MKKFNLYILILMEDLYKENDEEFKKLHEIEVLKKKKKMILI